MASKTPASSKTAEQALKTPGLADSNSSSNSASSSLPSVQAMSASKFAQMRKMERATSKAKDYEEDAPEGEASAIVSSEDALDIGSPIAPANTDDVILLAQASGNSPAEGSGKSSSSEVLASSASTGIGSLAIGLGSALAFGVVRQEWVRGSGVRDQNDNVINKPAAPMLSLAVDSGSSSNDGVTNNGTVNVIGLEPNATWSYSTDGGQTWKEGVGSSFELTGDGEKSVVLRQTNLAGSTSDNSVALAFTLDTKFPDLLQLKAHSNGGTQPGTLELVFSEPISPDNLPAASAFLVTVNGKSVTANGLSALGDTVILTFEAGVIVSGNLQLTIVYADPSAENDAVAVQDSAGNDVGSINLSSGVVADGYIRGAQMYLDGPDGLIELMGVVTDSFGNFFLPLGINPQGYALVAKGGVNIDTGLPNVALLKAPAGSTTVNPITTLVQAVVDQAREQGQPVDAQTAASDVAKSLGLLLPEGQSLTSYDPLSEQGDNAVAAQKAAAQLATLTFLASNGTADVQVASDQVLSNLAAIVLNNSANTIQNPISLSDGLVLSQALSGLDVSQATQSNLLDANAAIGAANSVSGISTAQSQFLDKIAPSAPLSLTVDALTTDSTPLVQLLLNVSSTDGKAVVEGDTVVLFDGAVEVGRKLLTATHISSGRVDIDSAQLDEGQHSLTSQVVDLAGNVSARSAAQSIQVDQSGPQATLFAATDNLAAGASTELTLILNEVIVGLSLEDFSVTGGGVLTALSGPQLVGGQQFYTLTYTAPLQGTAGTVKLVADGYTDGAGNAGAQSNTLDLAIVNPPVLNINSAGGLDRLISSQEGDTEIHGTAQLINSPVIISSGQIMLGQAQVSNGAWSYQLTAENLIDLQQGVGKEITASQTRTVGGNDYTGSTTVTVAIDTLAPNDPVINDVAFNNLINAVQVVQGVSLTGTAEAGARLELTVAGITKALTVNEQGQWTYTLNTADFKALETSGADIKMVAVSVDAAGNRSNAVEKAFSVDTLAPLLGLVRLADVSDTGALGDAKTSQRQPVIGFTAEEGATLFLDIGEGYAEAGIGSGALQNLTLSNAELIDGNYTVKLMAVDAAGNQSVRTATIVVDATGPSITSGGLAAAIDEGSGTGQIIYTAASTDASAVSYSLKADTGDASAFTINSKTGAVSLTANPNFETQSSYSFTVVATDAAGNATEQAVAMTVTDVNEAPTAQGSVSTQTAVNGQAFSFNVNGNFADVDAGTNGTLSFSATGLPSGLSINTSTGVISGTATADLASTQVFVTATDGGALAVTQSFNLGVVSAPTITALSANVAVANSGDALTFTATLSEAVIVNTTGGTPTLTLDVGGQVLTATYSGGSGTTSLSFTATAGAGDDSTVSVSAINLNGASIIGNTTSQGLLTGITGQVVASLIVDNTNPVFTSGITANFAENGASTAYSAAATDATALTYSLSGTDSGLFSISSSTGAVSFIAQPNFESPVDAGNNNVYDITVTATDAAGNASNRAVAITVTNVNEAPTVTSAATGSFAENGSGAVYTASATDPDAGTALSYSLGGADASLFDINSSTGVVSFKASPNFEGPTDAGGNNVYDITVTATDDGTGTLSSNIHSVAITVTNVNEAPTVISAATASFAENGSGPVYTASATDPDASTTLSYSLSGADAALFSIDASTGVVRFVSAPNFEAPADAGGNNVYDVVVTATDNGSLTATKAVAVTVTDINEAPTAQGSVLAQTAVNGQAYSFNVSGNFADVDAGTNGTLSFSATGLPSGLSINSATGVISGTATADQASAQVVVTATDGGALAVTQSFNLGVVSAPTITALSANVAVANSGDALTFMATLSEAVIVNTTGGTPTLTLDVGGQVLTATYSGGSGTTSLSFTATAGAGDDSTVSVSAINLNGASIIGNTTSQALLTGTTGQVVTNLIVDNTNPVFTSGNTANFAENGAGIVYATAATDVTTLTYALGGADASLFTINTSTGAVSFKTSPNFESPADVGTNNVYDITVTATDGPGNSSNQSVAITVTNVNEAPSVSSTATASYAENGSGAVYTASATDPDAGTTLSYSLSGVDAALFSIDASTGVLRFAEAPNFEAPTDTGGNNVYDVVVTATDNGTLSATKAVAITVTNVNEAPTVTSAATTSFAENGSGTVYTATSTDPDAGAVLSYSLDGADADLFNINSSTGVVTFKTSPNFEAPADAGGNNVYDVVVTATDNGSLTATKAVAVTVTDINEAPTAQGSVLAQTAVNGQAFSFNVSGNFADVDAGTNGTLSFSATGLPSGLSINTSTGVISGTATADLASTQVFVTATDGGALAVTQSFNLGVVSAPTITALSANVAVANSGDALTFTATLSEAVIVNTTGGTPTLTLDVGGQVLTATYSGGSGTTSLSFTATAGAGDDSTVSVSAINLNGASIIGNTTSQGLLTGITGQVVASLIVDNTNPVFTSGITANFAENGASTAYSAAATDATALTYSLSGTDSGLFSISSSTGAESIIAQPNFESPRDPGNNNVYDITVTATDAAGNASNRAVAITVTNVNEAPTVTSAATGSFAENGSGAVYTASATDPDAGTALSYSLGGADASLFDINSSTGVVSFKASPNFEGPTDAGGNNVYDITVTATDDGTGTLSSNIHSVAITVTNVNEAPTVTSAATASFAENGSGVVYTASATDPDASTTLSYSLSGADAALFSIDASTGVVRFVSAPNFEAPADAGGNNVYDVVVTATDNGSLTATKAVAITVTNVNDAPTVTSAATTNFAENGAGAVYTASATDPDAGATLSYSLSGTDADLFNINSSTGVVSFVSATNFEAPADADGNNVYDIVVTATDNGTLSATKAVAITVTNVNEAPTVSSAATTSFAENGSGAVYTAIATDPDASTTLSYSLSGVDAALFSIDASTGVLRFAEAPNFEAPTDTGGNNVYDILVTATDNGSLTATKAVVVTVTNVNDAPTLTSAATANFAENGSGTVYTATATDPDAGNTLSYSLSGTDADLFNINSTSGAVTFNAPPNFEAKSSYSINVVASDGSLSDTQAVAITVTNVNEAPTVTSAATASFAENGSGPVYTASATDPDAGTTLSYSLSGTDADLFNINSSTGVVTFKTSPNFEVKADAGGNNVYDIFVTATDNGFLAATKAVAVTVTDINEAPTAQGSVSAQTAVNGQAFSLNVKDSFADVDAGTNGTLSFSATGLPSGLSINTSTGVITGTATADQASAQVVVTATDGGALAVTQSFNLGVVSAPQLRSSALDNVKNFDVNSNIVIQYDQSVTAVAGKYIHIVNDGGVGFRGESVVHTQSILLTDTTQVTISQGKITINPIFDLDLANTYHITLDEGAFMSSLSGLATVAFDGTTSLNFSTVTPGTTSIANAVASQKMDADGAMVDSYRWLDIEGVGSPSASAVALDLVGGNYALVAKDYDASGGNIISGYDGIALGDLNVALNSFVLGDLIYIDDQGNNLNALNDLMLTAPLDKGVAPTPIQFAGAVLGLGGFIEVSLLSSTASFDSINALNQLVGGTAVIAA